MACPHDLLKQLLLRIEQYLTIPIKGLRGECDSTIYAADTTISGNHPNISTDTEAMFVDNNFFG